MKLPEPLSFFRVQFKPNAPDKREFRAARRVNIAFRVRMRLGHLTDRYAAPTPVDKALKALTIARFESHKAAASDRLLPAQTPLLVRELRRAVIAAKQSPEA